MSLASLCCVAALAAASPSRADNRVLDTIGPWEISLIEHGSYTSCTAAASYKNGSYLIVRKYSVQPDFYIELYNDSWRSVKNEETYRVDIDFHPGKDDAYYSDSATGINENNLVGIQFSVGLDFLESFRDKNFMEVFVNQGAKIGEFSLANSAKSIEALAKCIMTYDASMREDPFENLPSNRSNGGDSDRRRDDAPSDPFVNL